MNGLSALKPKGLAPAMLMTMVLLIGALGALPPAMAHHECSNEVLPGVLVACARVDIDNPLAWEVRESGPAIVAATLDAYIYAFPLPTGGSLKLTCGVVAIEGDVLDPCATAQGIREERKLGPINVAPTQPTLGPAIAFSANVTVLVAGNGVEDIPIIWVPRAMGWGLDCQAPYCTPRVHAPPLTWP
jgi:hypothetical protein